MHVDICPTADAAAARAAALIGGHLEGGIAERGFASVALSGGQTPRLMHRELAATPIAWTRVHLFQVDERLVPEDDERSNMREIRAAFSACSIPAGQIHAMAGIAAAPEDGADRYSDELRAVAGTPPVLDVVHLGLGPEGHTASLFPGDEAVNAGGDVTLAGLHAGTRRMTLTLATLNRARARVWLVTGSSKRETVKRLLERDPELIATRISVEDSILVLDQAASTGRQ